LFASASASTPRLPSDFCACSIAASASVKKSSSSAGSFSRSRVTTMIAIMTSPGQCRSDDIPLNRTGAAHVVPDRDQTHPGGGEWCPGRA